MSDSHVIARKFRPQTFDQVIGQESITRTLNNALKNDRVHHAYLFTGPRGVGKTTTARILAKSLNCAKGVTTTPCDSCSSCVEIAASRSIDVLEIDAASNTGVDNVRDVIINSISIAPARDRNKIFIIDEVHMLSTPAFNALLKTLEEPPPRVVFILATTDLQKVPDTILSRCQVFEFRAITLKKIASELRRIAGAEKIEISDSALLAIARAGEGSMRDAESALDQVISFSGTKVQDDDVSAALGLVSIETLNDTIQAIAEQDPERLVRIVDGVVSRGYDLRTFCREMMVHIRALLVVKIIGFDSELVQLPATEADTLTRLATYFSEQDLVRFFSILTKTEQDIRNSSQPRFQLEIGLVKLAQSRRLYRLEEAIERLEALESRLTGTASAAPRAQSAQGPSRPAVASGRPSPPARVATTARPESNPRRPQPKEQASTSPAESPGSIASVSVSAAPSMTATETPEIDESAAGEQSSAKSPAAPTDVDLINRIKGALEARRKMMIVTALDKGSISIEGDQLCVSYEPEHSKCKHEIETRDKRIAIEAACEEVLGRRLSLRATITGEPEAAIGIRPKEKPKQTVDEHPKLRALVDKFHGEIIELKESDT